MPSAGFTRETKVSKTNPCRVCGHHDWCVNFPDDWTMCQRTESDRFCENTGGHFHWTGQGHAPGDWRDRLYAPPRATIAPAVSDAPPIDPVIRRRGLEAIVMACPLSDDHRGALIGRGLTAEQIARHGYGSLPGDWDGRRAVARAVIAACGDDAYGNVPGLFRDGQGPMIAGVTGVLIPSRDLAGDLQGLRLRPDDPGDGGKYRWVSSPTMSGGAGSGAPTHVALPATPPATITRVLVTEGELKANIAADRLGIPVVAMAGATITRDVLALVLALGATSVVLALDADRLTNEHVGRADRRLGDELAAAGLTVFRATWAGTAKGIDDALAAGVAIVFEPARPAADAACRLEVRDLTQRVAHLETEVGRLKRTNAAIIATATNPNIKAEAVTALRLAADIQHRRDQGEQPTEDGFMKVRPAALGEDYAASPDDPGRLLPIRGRGTINRHLQTFAAAGLIERKIVPGTVKMIARDPKTKAPILDPDTGKPRRQDVRVDETWCKVTGATVLEILDPFARYRPAPATDPTAEPPKRHGGKRVKGERVACPDCGGTELACVACGTIFAAPEPPPDPPAVTVAASVFQDEPVKYVFTTPPYPAPHGPSATVFQDETRSPGLAPSPRPVPDLGPAREAIAADDRPGLFATLAAEAVAHGRTPVPKPGGRSPWDPDMTERGWAP